MMKAIIIDDEPKSRMNLQIMLSDYCKELTVSGTAGDLETAWEQIRDVQPDLVFLDIELNGGTGFDLLSDLPNRSFDVIFVTAYCDYALKALKEQALDYILKPIDPDELVAAVKKAFFKRKLQQPAAILEQLMHLQSQPASPKTKKIQIPFEGGIRFQEIENIIHVRSINNYSELFLRSGEMILCTIPIGRLEEMLEGTSLLRVHQSHIVNLDCVQKYHKNDGGILELIEGTRIQISRRKRDVLLQRFRDFSIYSSQRIITVNDFKSNSSDCS